MAAPELATPKRRRSWAGRLARLVGGLVLAAIALVALGVGLLLLPAVRSPLLGFVLDRVDDALPGELTVERTAWPELLRLELEGLRWEREAAELAAAERVVVDLAVRPLLEAKVVVRELTATGATADVPAIRDALSTGAADPDSAEVPDPEPSEPFSLPFRDVTLDSLDVSARVRVDDSRIVEAELRSEHSGKVDLRVASETDGEPEADLAGTFEWVWPPLGVALDVAGFVRGTELPGLYLAVELPEGIGGPIDAQVEVQVSEAAALARATVDLGDPIRILLRPVTVWRRGTEPLAATGGDAAIVIGDDRVEVSGLRVIGALGDVQADADVRLGGAGPSGEASLGFAIAPPAELAALFPDALPEDLRIDDLGELRGELAGSFAVEASGPTFDASLDLADTEWLAAGFVRARGHGTTIEIDSLALAMSGLSVEAHGAVGDTLDVATRIRLPDASFISRLPALRDVEVEMDLSVSASGPRTSPELEGSLDFAIMQLPELIELFPGALPESLRIDDLEELRGELFGHFATGAPGPSFDATLDLAGTDWLDAGYVQARGQGTTIEVDSLALAMSGLSVEARGVVGDTLDVQTRIRIPDPSFVSRLPALREVEIDLDLSAGARGPRASPELEASLSGRGAFAGTTVPAVDLRVATRAGSVDVALDLPEGLSSGTRTLQRADLDATVPFPLPEAPGGRLRLHAIGEDVEAALAVSVSNGDTVRVSADTLGVTLGGESIGSESPFTVSFHRGTNRLAFDDIRLGGSIGRLSADGVWTEDSVRVDLDADLSVPILALEEILPVQMLPREEQLVAELEAKGRLRGAATAPRMTLASALRLTGNPNLETLAVELNVQVSPDATQTADLPTVRGVGGRVRLTMSDRELLLVTLGIPARVELAPPLFQPTDDDSLHIEVRSEPVSLAQLRPFLPSGVSLQGEVEVDTSLRRARLEDPLGLDGQIDVHNFRLDLDDGSWVEAGGRIELAGNSRRPEVEGKITVVGGVIALPELPPDLLPKEGDAILWSEDATVTVDMPELPLDELGGDRSPKRTDEVGEGARDDPDSTATANGPLGDEPMEAKSPTAGAVPAAAPESFAADVGVAIDIPQSIHLRGQGLQVELWGELELRFREEPVIVGELRARRGTFNFLGRQFQVERGVVAFFGNPETDPVLDLTLELRISTTTYRVKVTGEAIRPKIELSSDPAMSEGDIVASILFGKPLDQLDSGQENLLQARMLAVLAQYGAQSVSGGVTKSLGVDMISFSESRDGKGSGALTIGKYLNPKTLVRYEQIIDREIAYVLWLEYALTQTVRVETAFGQGTESGIQLNWAKEF